MDVRLMTRQQDDPITDLLTRTRALVDELTEVARMERERLAGVTWRHAVELAASAGGSPTTDDGVHERITADAQWYAHLLGTPPVVF